MELKRVVVTGLGALTPVGNNINEYWDGLIHGKSGCAPITYFDTEKFKTKFTCELKNFDVSLHLDRKQQRKMDRFTQYGMVSTEVLTLVVLKLFKMKLSISLMAMEHQGLIPFLYLK